MKSLLFLAFFVAFSVASVTIFPSTAKTTPGVRTAQPTFIQNNAPYQANGNGIIANVTFEVFVIPLPGSSGVSSVEYSNPWFNITTDMNLITGTYLGAIASGVVNGTAPWFLTASAGAYGVIYYARYIQYGKVFSAYNYSIISVNNNNAREEQQQQLEYSPDQTAIEARDGSTNEISCALPGGCEFNGEDQIPTWNKFSWLASSNYAVYLMQYSAVCNDSFVALNLYSGSATQNTTAHSGGSIMFTISGRLGSYALRFTLKYAHATPRNGPANYTWVSPWYPFYITQTPNGGGQPVRREDEQVMMQDFAAYIKNTHFETETEAPQKTVSAQFAFGAGAAVAAAVALVIVAIGALVLRSKNKSNTTGTA